MKSTNINKTIDWFKSLTPTSQKMDRAHSTASRARMHVHYVLCYCSLKARSQRHNSTQRRVGEVSIATQTQLNSTDLLCADWLYASTGSVALPIVGYSWIASVRVSIATQHNSTSSWVVLSCYRRRVELCRRVAIDTSLTQLNSTWSCVSEVFIATRRRDTT